MRKKLGSVCMGLGLLLLLAAIALLGYNEIEDYRAGASVAAIQDALDSAIEDSATGDSADDTAGSLTGEEDSAADSAMDTIEIDGNDYIGTLTIPSLGLELPIMSQWSYAGMKIAPGRYAGSVSTDDLVICGHNYSRHFGKLKYLESGDVIYFTDVDGNVFHYEVKEIVILQPSDVEMMISRESGEWDLTLFTCTVGGRTRVTVRCSRTA